jgi:hypothetical protein
LIATAILGLLAGCGVGERDTGNDNDEEEVARTVINYIHAVAAADGKAACAKLTRQQAHAVLVGARVKLPNLHAQNCADALTGVGLGLARPVRAAMLAAPIVNIRTAGAKARAELLGGTTIIRLDQDDRGRWLIAGGLNLWTLHPYEGQRSSPRIAGVVQ